MTMAATMWLDSYKYHVLYCSVYIGIIAVCWQNASVATAVAAAVAASAEETLFSFSFFCWSILGLLVGYCLYFELRYMWMRRNLPPGDNGLPILGHLPYIIESPYDFIEQYMSKYGAPCTFNLLMKPIVHITSEDDMTWALKEERKGHFVPDLVPFLMDLLGRETIMMSSGQHHKRLRRMFEPTFSPAAVKSYTQTMDKVTLQAMKEWSESGEYHTSKEWANLAMKLFFVCALGEDMLDDELFDELTRLFEQWEVGFRTSLPLKLPGTALWIGHKGKEGVDNLLMQIIDSFRKKNPKDSTVASSSSGRSMLGRLCFDDDPLSDSQIAANIRFIVFAGHDTTKGSFGAFLHFFFNGLGASIKSKLMDEVCSFQEPLDPDELKSAPILNAFLAETWRLAPPLDSHNMKATRNVDHPDGWTITKGTNVSIELQYWSMDDLDQYPNPTEFRMERWIPEGHPLYDPKYFRKGVDYNVMNVKYRSFHSGAHMCLGGHFAKLEARIVMTRLLQKYNIQLQNESLKHFPLRQYSNEFKLTPRQD